jgi:hypothetical protein
MTYRRMMALWNVWVDISVPLTPHQRSQIFGAIEDDPRSPDDGMVGDPAGKRESAWLSVEAPSAKEAAAVAAEIVGNGLRRMGVSAELVTDRWVEDANRQLVEAEPARISV